jgi:hypothetical protein
LSVTARIRLAIVVGLGPVGELTPERLRLVFAMALRRHALAVLEGHQRWTALGCLQHCLVGTDGGGSGVAD